MGSQEFASLDQLFDPPSVDPVFLCVLPPLEGILDHIVFEFLIDDLLLQGLDHPILLLKLLLLRGQLLHIAHPLPLRHLLRPLDGMHELVDADPLALDVGGLVDLGLRVAGLDYFLEFVGALDWFSTHYWVYNIKGWMGGFRGALS